jgi:hypothetical protein
VTNSSFGGSIRQTIFPKIRQLFEKPDQQATTTNCRKIGERQPEKTARERSVVSRENRKQPGSVSHSIWDFGFGIADFLNPGLESENSKFAVSGRKRFAFSSETADQKQ